MTVNQSPTDYEFAGNFPDIKVESVIAIDVTLKYFEGDIILEESYQPDAADEITIELREFFENLLNSEVPGISEESYHQQNGYGHFSVILDDGAETQYDFYCIAGGGKNLPSNFIGTFFHTWQPITKYISTESIEYVTIFPKLGGEVRATFTYQDGTTDFVDVADVTANQLNTVNISPYLINADYQNLKQIEIYAHTDGIQFSNKLTYKLTTESFKYDDQFIFINSLGGVDSIRFTGQLERIEEFNIETGLFGRETLEYHSESDQKWKKNTGLFRSKHELLWARDFFGSVDKFWYRIGDYQSVLTYGSFESIDTGLNSYDFEFQLASLTTSQDYFEIYGLPKPPTAPSNLLAVVFSDTENRITWTDNSDDETGFEIWRSDDDGETFSKVGEVGENITEFIDDISI